MQIGLTIPQHPKAGVNAMTGFPEFPGDAIDAVVVFTQFSRICVQNHIPDWDLQQCNYGPTLLLQFSII